jgi:hypothetical protein
VALLVGDLGGDRDGFSGFRLGSPIRLTLEAAIVPQAHLFPQCATLEDDVGNSVGGIPVQYYREVRLLPRLVLGVFTRLGCPIDAGIGATLTYAVPIRKSLAFVLSGGMYTAPAQAPLFGGWGQALGRGLLGQPSSISGAARADIAFTPPDGRTLSVGIESLGTQVRGFRFAGGF